MTVNEKQTKWRQENKDKVKIASKKYYDKHIRKPKKKHYFHESIMFDLWERGGVQEKIITVELKVGQKEKSFMLWNLDKNLTPTEEIYFWGIITKLIHGIIFTHRFIRFASFEDCEAFGVEAVVTALGRYDPSVMVPDRKLKDGTMKPTSLFSYLSLTIKRAIMFATIKQSEHKKAYSYEQSLENGYDIACPVDWFQEYDSFRQTTISLVNRAPITDAARADCLIMADLMTNFLKLKSSSPSKRQLFQYFRHFNPEISPNRVRGFLNILRDGRVDVMSSLY